MKENSRILSPWDAIQRDIDNCRDCKQQVVKYLHVPCGKKRHPESPPRAPIKLFFVSVAPPWGGDYFWDEKKKDAVREGLFRALEFATDESFKTLSDFTNAGYFLVPTVKCPSTKDGKDYKPSKKAIDNCSSFLQDELEFARAQRVLALGKDAMKGVKAALDLKDIPEKVKEFRKKTSKIILAGREIPVTGTYFPGNDRHQGKDKIVDDIKNILKIEPRINSYGG